MRSVFRPTTPADGAAISLLMQEVFAMPSSHPSFSPEMMDWNYWRPHPDWTGSRGYVIEREGSILAHGAVIPLRWARGAERRRIVHLIDWAARPKATGAGIALMTNVAREAGGVFAAGGSEMTEKILPALGFREFGRATRFVLPLRPLARFKHEAFSSWRPLARLARNLLWKFQAQPLDVSGWSARLIPAADIESGGHGDFPLPHHAGEAVFFERSVPVIAYWLACPSVPFEFYLVQRRGTVCGYFLLTRVQAQCRIVNAWIEPEWTEPDRMEHWRALYLLAARAAYAHPGMAELVTVAGGAEAEVLAQAGFRARGQVTLRFSVPGAAPMPSRYQMVDSDAAFLQDGCPPFWS